MSSGRSSYQSLLLLGAVALLAVAVVLLQLNAGIADEDGSNATDSLKNELEPRTPPRNSGWVMVAVYAHAAPDADPDPDRKGVYMSQGGQDRTIEEIFEGKPGGFFVDLASNNATGDSNTFALERKLGWRGLCIEPNPGYFSGYLHRECRLVQAVAGRTDGQIVHINVPGGMGALGKVGQAPPASGNGDATVGRFATVNLGKILRDFDAPKVIEYLNLDIEGSETAVMSAFPWDEFTFLTMTVERPDATLQGLLQTNGFTMLCQHGWWGDLFYVHKSHPRFDAVVAKYGGDGGECNVKRNDGHLYKPPSN